MPQFNQVHIDQALTNISIAYVNDDYVAGRVLPQLPVEKQSDRYFVYGKEHLRVKESRVRPGAIADEFEYTLSQASYYATRRARRHLVTDEETRIADNPLLPEADSAEILTDLLTLILENDVATYLTSSTNLTNFVALSGGNQWSDFVNSAPLTNIKTARTSVRYNALKRANSIIIPYETALVLAEHPSIKDLIKYTDPKSLTIGGLPPVIRGLTVIEPAAIADSSVEGLAFTGLPVWGKNVIVCYINPNAGRRVISMGYTFMATDSITNAMGVNTRKYRDEPRGGDWIETAATYDFRVTAVGAGYLFNTVIA